MVAKKKAKKSIKKKVTKAQRPTPDFLKDHAVEVNKELTLALPSDQLERLSEAVDRMATLKGIHDNNKTTNARVWAEYVKYELTATNLLKENNLPSFENETHKIKINVKSSIKVPKTDEDKKALFDWIADNKGDKVLLAYLSISSTSLNKFYNEEAALYFEKTGETSFIMDGVLPPTSHEKLSLKKVK